MARCSNVTSTVLQLILLSLAASLAMAAPLRTTRSALLRTVRSVPSAAELNATYALKQMKNGVEVLRRVHEGKLFSVVRSEADKTNAVESSSVSLDLLTNAVNITCALRDAKNNLWSLDGITGEQPASVLRLLRFMTENLIQTSCEWTKHILSQLYPESDIRLQCTCEEVDIICDEYTLLNKAKMALHFMEVYNPTVSGEIDWIETNLPQPDSSTPLLQRFVHYVHNEPMGL